MKALLYLTDAHPEKIVKCDVLSYNDKNWLVPDWLENYASGKMKPIRIILLDSLPHQQIDKETWAADFLINEPIPVCIFSGQLSTQITLDLN